MYRYGAVDRYGLMVQISKLLGLGVLIEAPGAGCLTPSAMHVSTAAPQFHGRVIAVALLADGCTQLRVAGLKAANPELGLY